MQDLPVKVLPFWPGINLSYTAKWEWYVKLTNLLLTCLLLFMEVLTHPLSSLINYGQCVPLQYLPPPPPLQQHLGQNGDQLCAEGDSFLRSNALVCTCFESPSRSTFCKWPDIALWEGLGEAELLVTWVSHPIYDQQAIDRFHTIFYHRNWRTIGSCDVDVDQSAGSMVM